MLCGVQFLNGLSEGEIVGSTVPAATMSQRSGKWHKLEVALKRHGMVQPQLFELAKTRENVRIIEISDN